LKHCVFYSKEYLFNFFWKFYKNYSSKGKYDFNITNFDSTIKIHLMIFNSSNRISLSILTKKKRISPSTSSKLSLLNKFQDI